MSVKIEKDRIKKRAEVEEYIESRNGRVIVHYETAKIKIVIIGSCGHGFEMKFNDIRKRGKKNMLCQVCNSRDSQKPMTEKDWIKRGENIGFSSISIYDNTVSLTCSCDHKTKMSFSGYRKRTQRKESQCRNCITNSKRDFTKLNVKRIVREGGGRMLSISDDNTLVKLRYKCGHEGEVTSDNIKHKITKYGYLLCPECSTIEHKSDTRISTQEKEMIKFIRSLDLLVKANYRENYPLGLEIDAFVPEKNIGFEFNGVYWHSEGKGKGKNYHLAKTKIFNEQGIQLYQFTDEEWNNKKDIVMSMIRSRLRKSLVRFEARKCKIVKINASEAKEFFTKNHIQGGSGSTHGTYALSTGGAIVAAMSFRRTPGLNDNSVELYRFATILNSNIAGGFSRLLSAFKKETEYLHVITYADYRFSSIDSENTVYGKSGFTFLHSSPPNYKYFKDNRKLLDRRLFQKHKLKDKLEVFDSAITEYQNMIANNYDRIWDCGNGVYRLDL